MSDFCGGIVRACKKGGWGVAVFDSLDNLAASVAQACTYAALAGQDKTDLAEVDIVDQEVRADFKRDFRGVSLKDKLAMISVYNDIILKKSPKIESSSAAYSDMLRTVYFANSQGTYYMEERPYINCRFLAVARDGSLIQRTHKGISSRGDYNELTGLENEAEKVAERALALLEAPKCEGGAKTVILDNELGGVFVHEAFGHLSEADFLQDNPNMRDLMSIGREMGVKELNIIDDATIPGCRGSYIYDDEGTPASKTYLVRDGQLAGHLHSRETAAKMGEKPTGHARALNRGNKPIVRMGNTYIENGDIPKEELFAGVDDGIYACQAFGGQTMMEMFTFSAAYGYRIRNGQIGELVRDVVLTGNVFDTLHNIDGIGNDLKLSKGGDGCGKNGQSPLPVGLGAPHIRIRNVVVGGNN